jgi:trans-aconitate methyltransferase
MIEFARGKFPPTRTPNLAFRLGDATRLNFDDDFDLVVSFACLHWVRDHVAVLKGIRRSLKSGGRVVLQFGGKGNAASVLDATADVVARSQWSPYFKGFGYTWAFCSPEEYAALLCQVGLVPQRIELVPKDMVHEGTRGLEGWMRTTFLPYIERVSETLRDKFVAESYKGTLSGILWTVRGRFMCK